MDADCEPGAEPGGLAVSPFPTFESASTEMISTLWHSASTSSTERSAGAIACHCLLNQLAISLCGPVSHGSRMMLNQRRDEPVEAEEGIGNWTSQVVSALTGIRSVHPLSHC